jgi:hypothetical protein
MADVLEKLFAQGTDREAARVNALEIARLVGSKAVANKRHVIGEPYCHYKVAMHTRDFWFTVFVSRNAYVVRGNLKRPTKKVCNGLNGFNVYVKAKPDYWGAPKCKRMVRTSKKLKAPVYVPDYEDENFVHRILFRRPIAKLLKRIDFSVFTECDFGILQLTAVVPLTSPARCVEQSTFLRALLVALFQDARERRKKGR